MTRSSQNFLKFHFINSLEQLYSLEFLSESLQTQWRDFKSIVIMNTSSISNGLDTYIKTLWQKLTYYIKKSEMITTRLTKSAVADKHVNEFSALTVGFEK